MHVALWVAGLGSFEITVEHETAGGLTTEVESKWPQSLKTEQDKYSPFPSLSFPVFVSQLVQLPLFCCLSLHLFLSQFVQLPLFCSVCLPICFSLNWSSFLCFALLLLECGQSQYLLS